jgi:hypothetical protein
MEEMSTFVILLTLSHTGILCMTCTGGGRKQIASS